MLFYVFQFFVFLRVFLLLLPIYSGKNVKPRHPIFEHVSADVLRKEIIRSAVDPDVYRDTVCIS